jgi:hypothetical protein
MGTFREAAQRALHLRRAAAHFASDNEAEMKASLKAHLATFRSPSADALKRRALFAGRIVFRRAGKPAPPELNPEPTAGE